MNGESYVFVNILTNNSKSWQDNFITEFTIPNPKNIVPILMVNNYIIVIV